MEHLTWNRNPRPRTSEGSSERRDLSLPGRIVWRDARGATRFATVRTRRLSEEWASVECLGGTPIPLYRLVHLQLDHPAHAASHVPSSLRHGKVLSAVYRVGPSLASTGLPEGYDLRLLVEPAQRAGTDEDPFEMADDGGDETGYVEVRSIA